MRHFKFGIPILGALTLATGLFGCADESHWGSSSNEKGRISLTLSTDSGIKTAKPVFRSEDEESSPDPNNLNSYITVPKPEDFSIKLEKSDETFSKTWTTLQGFLDYTEKESVTTGAYTLTAFYGEKGKQDFNAPYFEASTTFNVLSDQTYEVNLLAQLMNSMVKVNYSERFKEYMRDFHSSLSTEGRTDEIIFGKEEIDPAFIEPNNATLYVHISPKDRDTSTQLEVGKFASLAKTLHNINLDIVENDNGTETLQVNFIDALEEEIVNIDLSDDLFTTEAPVISCKGFNDGETIEVLEKTACPSKIEMIANIPGLLGSATLTVESTERPEWGAEIDLCKATSTQIEAIKAAGIEAVGFGLDRPASSSYEIAMLDLTNYGSSLPSGTHKISLTVTDKLGRSSNTTSVTLDSQPIELEVIGTPTIGYCAKNTSVTVDYNGNNPTLELRFKTKDDYGKDADIKVLSSEEVAASRSFDKKQYIIELLLPDNVTVARKKIGVDIYHKGNEEESKASCNINVTVPQYDLQYNEYSNHSFIKVNIPDNENPELLSTIVSNLQLKLNNEKISTGVMKFPEDGYLLVKGLNPATTYSVSSSITKGENYNDHVSLNTEAYQPIPNGDFSPTKVSKLESETLNVGGEWHASLVKNWQHTSTFSYNVPNGWTTINELTAWNDSKNKNTWYIVPSSWTEEEKGVMRNVGYNHDGRTLNNTGSAWSYDYYCTDHPSESELEHAAGVLALGSYDDITKTWTGIEFNSRPSKISFDYEYNNDSEKIKPEFNDDKGYAFIELLDKDGNSLGKKEFVIERGSGSKSISFDNYGLFQSKAAKLVIIFKSSNNNELPPIHIPSGSELNENTKKEGVKLPANSYHAVATGSILKIDNVVAHYGDEETPANAQKKSSKKNR